MKKVILFIFLLLTFSIGYNWNTLASSKVKELEEVESSGEGVSENDAFRQAVVDAVRQVTGTLVASETLIEDEEVIKDEVLTLSNGFVEKVLEQKKTKNSDGTWTVKLKCIVRKGKVYEKLKEAHIPTIKVDGTSLFADVLSHIEYAKDAEKMLEKVLEDYPAKLITAEMIGKRPEFVSGDDKETKLKIKWKISWNQKMFFENFVPALVEVLEEIKLSDKEISSKNQSEMLHFSVLTQDNPDLMEKMKKDIYDIHIHDIQKTINTVVGLKHFLVDKKILKNYFYLPKSLNDAFIIPRSIDVLILFLDEFNNVMAFDHRGLYFYIYDGSPFGWSCYNSVYVGISPVFWSDRSSKKYGSYDRKYSIEEELFDELSVPTEILPKVTEIRFVVGNSINDGNWDLSPHSGHIIYANLLKNDKSAYEQGGGIKCFMKCLDVRDSGERTYELYEIPFKEKLRLGDRLDVVMEELKGKKILTRPQISGRSSKKEGEWSLFRVSTMGEDLFNSYPHEYLPWKDEEDIKTDF